MLLIRQTHSSTRENPSYALAAWVQRWFSLVESRVNLTDNNPAFRSEQRQYIFLCFFKPFLPVLFFHNAVPSLSLICYVSIFQSGDDFCSIVVTNSRRSDSGFYRLQLRNEKGFDSVNFNVKVLDRPSPPENLRVEEYSGESLVLVWHPPRDNGGGEITNYIIEKKEPKSLTWGKVSQLHNYFTAHLFAGHFNYFNSFFFGLCINRDFLFKQ